MKKLAIVLGSLVALSTVAAAKEVMVEPIVVAEPIIVEKIVYRDVIVAPAWRPTGGLDLSYKFYAPDEYGSNKYGRMQLQGELQMTANQKLEYRVRTYNTLSSMKSATDEGNATDVRLRYFYNHGNIGATKINYTSRIQYENNQDSGYSKLENMQDGAMAPILGKNSQNVEYMARLQFSEYMTWTPEWFKNTNLTVAPRYRFTTASTHDSNYTNTLGMDLYSNFKLPMGFTTEFNLYPSWNNRGAANGDYNSFNLDVEAYVYYTRNLWTSGAYTFDFNFEGGLDPYSTTNRIAKMNDTADMFKTKNSEYVLYALPSLELAYQATEHVKAYAAAGAEYKNWRNTSAHTAQDWSWMPQATVGFNVIF